MHSMPTFIDDEVIHLLMISDQVRLVLMNQD